MKPTNELRFVERIIYFHAASGDLKYEQRVKILQQKWIDPRYPEHPMWRDVPVEKETP